MLDECAVRAVRKIRRPKIHDGRLLITYSSSDSSEIGQLMIYLLAAHFKRFSITRAVPAHVLGLYIKDMKVSVYTVDLTLSVYLFIL